MKGRKKDERTELIVQKKRDELQQYLRSRHETLVTWTDGDERRAKRLRMQVMLATTQTPQLVYCPPVTVYTACLALLQMGLELNPAKGSAYVVPFTHQGVPLATPIPGYRGLLTLVQRSGISPTARLVYEHDEFIEHYGTEFRVEHRPPPMGEDRGKLIGGYAVASVAGEWVHVRMDRTELERRRRLAQRGNKESPAWRNWPEQMYLKTLLRSICKLLPLDDDRIYLATTIDSATAGGRHRDYYEAVINSPAAEHAGVPPEVHEEMGQIIDVAEAHEFDAERMAWQDLILKCRTPQELLNLRRDESWQQMSAEIRADVERAWGERNKVLLGGRGKRAREAANDDLPEYLGGKGDQA